MCNRTQNDIPFKKLGLAQYSKGRVIHESGSFFLPNQMAPSLHRYLRNRTRLLPGKPPSYEIVKVACKGVPTGLAYDFILRGAALVKKPMRFKESQVRTHAVANQDKGDEFLREIGANVWRTVEKKMRSIYIKRIGDTTTRPVDISEIEGLEQNVISEDDPSIEQEILSRYNLQRPEDPKAFDDIQKPTPTLRFRKSKEFTVHASTKIHFLRPQECDALNPGDIWFEGKILSLETKTYRYYKIALDIWKGTPAPPNFLAAYSAELSLYFDFEKKDEDYVGSRVQVVLASKYIDSRSPDITVNLLSGSDGLPPADDDNKINPGDTDWSQLDEYSNQINH